MGKEEKDAKHGEASQPQPQTVTMSVEALAALVDAKVAEAMGRAKAGELSLTEQFAQQMDRLRGRDAPAADVKRFACISPTTEATFTAVVVFGGRHKNGRCLTLEDYKEPDGCWKSEKEGGRVPDGIQVFSNTPSEVMGADGRVSVQARNVRTRDHRKWLWENFYKRDLIEFCNKPFTPYILATETEARRKRETEIDLSKAAE